MYQLRNDNTILRLSDGAFIPKYEGNRDYDEYLAWVAAGNEPLPYEEPEAPVPLVISRFQALAALYQSGLLEAAQQAVSQAGGMAMLAWDNATEFHRDSPTLLAMASALGLDDEALDNLFRLGASIRA